MEFCSGEDHFLSNSLINLGTCWESMFALNSGSARFVRFGLKVIIKVEYLKKK